MPKTTAGARLLAAFLKSRGITLLAAAGAIGVSGPTILDWRRGTKRPSSHLRKAIASWSGGEVPEESWMTPAEAASVRVTPFTAPALRQRAS